MVAADVNICLSYVSNILKNADRFFGCFCSRVSSIYNRIGLMLKRPIVHILQLKRLSDFFPG